MAKNKLKKYDCAIEKDECEINLIVVSRTFSYSLTLKRLP